MNPMKKLIRRSDRPSQMAARPSTGRSSDFQAEKTTPSRRQMLDCIERNNGEEIGSLSFAWLQRRGRHGIAP